MNSSLFNEVLLDATVISMARDTMQSLMHKRLGEWLPKVPSIHHPHFVHAMDAFIALSEDAAEKGNVEAMVELVQQFRNYEPMFTREKFARFDQRCFAFGKVLVYLPYREYPGDPVKYKTLSKPFSDQTFKFIDQVSIARRLLDEKMLNQLISEWNKIAAEWKKVIDDNFPLPENVLSVYHYQQII